MGKLLAALQELAGSPTPESRTLTQKYADIIQQQREQIISLNQNLEKLQLKIDTLSQKTAINSAETVSTVSKFSDHNQVIMTIAFIGIMAGLAFLGLRLCQDSSTVINSVRGLSKSIQNETESIKKYSESTTDTSKTLATEIKTAVSDSIDAQTAILRHTSSLENDQVMQGITGIRRVLDVKLANFTTPAERAAQNILDMAERAAAGVNPSFSQAANSALAESKTSTESVIQSSVWGSTSAGSQILDHNSLSPIDTARSQSYSSVQQATKMVSSMNDSQASSHENLNFFLNAPGVGVDTPTTVSSPIGSTFPPIEADVTVYSSGVETFVTAVSTTPSSETVAAVTSSVADTATVLTSTSSTTAVAESTPSIVGSVSNTLKGNFASFGKQLLKSCCATTDTISQGSSTAEPSLTDAELVARFKQTGSFATPKK